MGALVGEIMETSIGMEASFTSGKAMDVNALRYGHLETYEKATGCFTMVKRGRMDVAKDIGKHVVVVGDKEDLR